LYSLSTPNENPEDNLYRKYEELHEQRGYTLSEMKDLVKEAGLILVAAYDAFTHEEATEECERVYIIAKECNQEGTKHDFAEEYNKQN